MTWAGLVQLCDAGAEPSVPPSPPDDGCPPPDDVLPDEPDDDALPEDDALPDEPEEDEEAPDEDGPPDDDELPDDEELLDDEAPVPAPRSPHPFAQERSKPRTEAGSRCRVMNPSIRVAHTRRWNGNRRATSTRSAGLGIGPCQDWPRLEAWCIRQGMHRARVSVFAVAALTACGSSVGTTEATNGDAGSFVDAATGAVGALDATSVDASSQPGDTGLEPDGGSNGGSIGDSDGGTDVGVDGPSKPPPSGRVFSAYKDTSIHLNWNTNVVSTTASGAAVSLATDLTANGSQAITLAFATGECGSENWAGVPGGTLASTNVPLLTQAGVQYIVSTGGAAGSFTCATDSGFATFLGRWASSGLIGVDFDIEGGQSTAQIGDLVRRIGTAHGTHPALRFSLTLATVANGGGASLAAPLGASVQDSFNTYGDQVMAAVQSTLGFSGATPTWPPYLTVDLMTMDYGAPSPGVCVVAGGACQMGQSAIQAAYNLHDRWGVPYGNIELTPMIGQNDQGGEHFTLSDVDTVSAFVIQMGLAGVHYWSYDRDVDCPAGSASSTCNSMGNGYAGDRGYLKRFLIDGL